MASHILHDLEIHQQCTLKSMQAFFIKALWLDKSEEALHSMHKEIMEKAETISKNAEVVTRLDAL